MSSYEGEFRFVVTAALRAHELNRGEKPVIDTQSVKPTTIALEEIEGSLVKSYFTKPPIVKQERHLEDLAASDIPLDVEDVGLEEEVVLDTDIFEQEEETVETGRKLPVQAKLEEEFEDDEEEFEDDDEEDLDEDLDFEDDYDDDLDEDSDDEDGEDE